MMEAGHFIAVAILIAGALLGHAAAVEPAELAPAANRLSSGLRQMVEADLGVVVMQDLLNRAVADEDDRDHPNEDEGSATAQQLARSLYAKVASYESILRRNKADIESYLQSNSSFHDAEHKVSPPPASRCCLMKPNLLKYDSQFGANVNKAFGCEVGQSSRRNEAALDILSNVSHIFAARQHEEEASWLRWRYFISNWPVPSLHLEYPSTAMSCDMDTYSRQREAVGSVLNPRPKAVIIALDRGQFMSDNLLSLARSTVQYITASLSTTDKLGVVALAEDIFFPLSYDCTSNKLLSASDDVKLEVEKFVNVVQVSGNATNHDLLAKAIEEMLRETTLDSHDEVHVFYLTRGHLTFPRAANQTLEKMVSLTEALRPKIIFNAYMLREDTNPSTATEANFLKQLSQLGHGMGQQQGEFAVLRSREELSQTVADYLAHNWQDASDEDDGRVSVGLSPDDVGGGAVLSLALAVRTPAGRAATGVDVQLETFIEELIYHGDSREVYPCLLEKLGDKVRVIFHPQLSRRHPLTTFSVELGDLEKSEELPALRQQILTQSVGSITMKQKHTYSWQWVDKTPFIVAVFSKSAHSSTKKLSACPSCSLDLLTGLVYHRLDLLQLRNRHSLCRAFRAQATRDACSLQLAPSSFIVPHLYFNEEALAGAMPSFMTFLQDNTRMIANPGLKEGVRQQLATFMQILPWWRNATSSALRRYVATVGGAYFAYPGARGLANFDPAGEEWFSRAQQFTHRVILSSSRLDSGGAGYVVSVSKAIGNVATGTVAVASMDVPIGFIRKMVLDAHPSCQQNGVRCFVFNNEGYLVVHPVMFDPTYVGDIVDIHLNHKEPVIAKDIVNHPKLLRVKFCKSPTDNTIRRYFDFDVGSSDVFTNTVHDEECFRYQITAIPGTNAFLGLANVSCAHATVFCPCNINNRKCIFCGQNRRDAERSCECPCECPLRRPWSCHGHDDGLSQDFSQLGLCPAQSDRSIRVVPRSSDRIEHLPACFASDCASFESKDVCLGAIGCSWCEVELEMSGDYNAPTFSALPSAYCAEQQRCFRGAVGATSPYALLDAGKMLRERSSSGTGDDDARAPSPVGSVAAGILVFFVFMAVSVFCYQQRFRETSSAGQCFRSSGSSQNRDTESTIMRVSNIEVEEDEDEEGPMALASPVAVMSPYRVNPGYRRPPPGTDSDNGYSTMTPLGGDVDSEVIMPYTESLVARHRLRHRPPPSMHSVTSGTSSRASSPTPQDLRFKPAGAAKAIENNPLSDNAQTVLPNQIVVSATVHMVDTQ